jgi:hypothetical protein
MSSIPLAIYEKLGYTNTRLVEAPAFDKAHVVSEVWYDNGWHHFDVQMRGFVLAGVPNRVATIVEITQNPFWVDYTVNQGYNIYPQGSDRSKVKSASPSDPYPNTYAYRRHELGHTMDHVLRMGETLTRYWVADSTRFLNNPNWYTSGSQGTRILNSSDKMWKVPHDRIHIHWETTGMVHFKYQPNLKNTHADYVDGYFDDSNVKQTTEGIESESANAYTVFQVKTPWPIIGKNGYDDNNLRNMTGMTEGAVLNFTTAGAGQVKVYVTYKYPDAENINWGTAIYAASSAGSHKIDFTEKVYGTYGYVMKLEFSSAGGRLTGLSLDTWGQCWPASLPMALSAQTNMTYSSMDVRGHQTVPGYVWQQKWDGQPIKITPPRGGKIKWFSAGALFSARRSDGSIQYSTDGTNYTRLWDQRNITSKINSTIMNQTGGVGSHWSCQYDSFHVFSTPVNSLWIKYTGQSAGSWDPVVHDARVYWHYEEYDRPVTSSPVQVIHNSLVSNNPKTKSATVQNKGETYSVEGGNLLFNKPTTMVMEVEPQPCNGNNCSMASRTDRSRTADYEPVIGITPNPFSTSVNIRVISSTVPQFRSSAVNPEIRIFDINGKFVSGLDNCGIVALWNRGTSYTWDASGQPAGIYFVKVSINNIVMIKRISLVR